MNNFHKCLLIAAMIAAVIKAAITKATTCILSFTIVIIDKKNSTFSSFEKPLFLLHQIDKHLSTIKSTIHLVTNLFEVDILEKKE